MINAQIWCESDFDFVKAELLKLIPITVKEPGCLSYVLHSDDQDPSHFMFHESWESRDLWQQHM